MEHAKHILNDATSVVSWPVVMTHIRSLVEKIESGGDEPLIVLHVTDMLKLLLSVASRISRASFAALASQVGRDTLPVILGGLAACRYASACKAYELVGILLALQPAISVSYLSLSPSHKGSIKSLVMKWLSDQDTRCDVFYFVNQIVGCAFEWNFGLDHSDYAVLERLAVRAALSCPVTQDPTPVIQFLTYRARELGPVLLSRIVHRLSARCSIAKHLNGSSAVLLRDLRDKTFEMSTTSVRSSQKPCGPHNTIAEDCSTSHSIQFPQLRFI